MDVYVFLGVSISPPERLMDNLISTTNLMLAVFLFLTYVYKILFDDYSWALQLTVDVPLRTHFVYSIVLTTSSWMTF